MPQQTTRTSSAHIFGVPSATGLQSPPKAKRKHPRCAVHGSLLYSSRRDAVPLPVSLATVLRPWMLSILPDPALTARKRRLAAGIEAHRSYISHPNVDIVLPRLRIEDDTLNPESVPLLAIMGHTAWFLPPQRSPSSSCLLQAPRLHVVGRHMPSFTGGLRWTAFEGAEDFWRRHAAPSHFQFYFQPFLCGTWSGQCWSTSCACYQKPRSSCALNRPTS